jgi:hypothetical protein
MRNAFVVGALLISVAVAGCAKTNSNFGNDQGAPPAVDPSQFQVKTANGYVAYSKTSILSVQAQVIVHTSTGDTSQTRTLSNTQSYHLISPLSLHAPNEGAIPEKFPVITGEMVVQYFTPSSETKNLRLVIYNEKYLRDNDNQATYYTSTTPLNTSWLFDNLIDEE